MACKQRRWMWLQGLSIQISTHHSYNVPRKFILITRLKKHNYISKGKSTHGGWSRKLLQSCNIQNCPETNGGGQVSCVALWIAIKPQQQQKIVIASSTQTLITIIIINALWNIVCFVYFAPRNGKKYTHTCILQIWKSVYLPQFWSQCGI